MTYPCYRGPRELQGTGNRGFEHGNGDQNVEFPVVAFCCDGFFDFLQALQGFALKAR
jgi:hypothetical protein